MLQTCRAAKHSLLDIVKMVASKLNKADQITESRPHEASRLKMLGTKSHVCWHVCISVQAVEHLLFTTIAQSTAAAALKQINLSKATFLIKRCH